MFWHSDGVWKIAIRFWTGMRDMIPTKILYRSAGQDVGRNGRLLDHMKKVFSSILLNQVDSVQMWKQ